MPVENKKTQPSHADNEMIRRIEESHSPEVRHGFSPQPVFDFVEIIFQRASLEPSLPGNTNEQQRTYEEELDAKEKKALQDGFRRIIHLVSDEINKLSNEMFCMCSADGDINAKTWAMLNPVSSYSWGAKLVIALAAFAGDYGQLALLAKLYHDNPLAKSVALIKCHPQQEIDALKPKFKEIIRNLLTASMDVTKSILEFEGLSSHYIAPRAEEIATATSQFPAAVYWIIRSLLACASLLTNITGVGRKTSNETQLWELSSLIAKVNYYSALLNEQLSLTYSHIDGQRETEIYERVVKTMQAPVSGDNMKIFRAMVFSKNDQLPLFNGVTKERARLDVLSRKNVLMFISNLKFETDTISIQRLIACRQLLGRRYEILWFPVVEQLDENNERKYTKLQSQMPWYSIYHPSLVEPGVIRFIKEVWQFNVEPLLVVFDPQGNLLNQNAIHMLRIWGTSAIPFTSNREAQLWNNQTWTIELLLDDLHPPASSWMQEQKYICLYGGEDIEWIHSFTTVAKEVATTANIPLEMLYVANYNLNQHFEGIISDIAMHRLSNILTNRTYFWLRLYSMRLSMNQHNKTEKDDPVVSGVMKMLNYNERSTQGWAVIGQCSSQAAIANGNLILRSLSEYTRWSQEAEEQGFVPALIDYLRKIHHCVRIILPGTAKELPSMMICFECGRPMEQFMLYRCCDDD